MKTISDIILESGLDEEGRIKNQVCIDLGKIIGQKLIDRISSDDSGHSWNIKLKAGEMDLIKVAEDISKIGEDKKYDCIKSIVFDYDQKIIMID